METESGKKDEWMATRLEYFGERTAVLFAHRLCSLELPSHKDYGEENCSGGKIFAFQVISRACFWMSLTILRDVNDFFLPRDKKTHPDDLRAEDFEVVSTGCFLRPDERTWINKLIVHSTHRGAEKGNYDWDIFELQFKAFEQLDAFLKGVMERHTSAKILTYTAALAIREGNSEMRKWAEEQRKLRDRQVLQPPCS